MIRKQIKNTYSKTTENLAYLVGVMMGDGYKQIDYIGLETKDKDFLGAFIKAGKEQFGIEPRIYKRKAREMKDPRNGKIYITKKRYVAKFFSRDVVDLFEKIENIKWVEKRNKEKQLAWLRGFWDSDGSVSNSAQQITLTQKNKNRIILYKQILEKRLNINSKIKHRNDQDIYYCYFGTQNNIKKFCSEVKPSIKKKLNSLIFL